MKTLTDLFTLIAKEIEISNSRLVKFTFDIDTRYNWLTFSKVYPVFSKTEVEIINGIERAKELKPQIEDLLKNTPFDTPEAIQQAYWTIYNEGRSKK